MLALHVVGRFAPIVLLVACAGPPGAPGAPGAPPAPRGYQALQAAPRQQPAASPVLQAFPFLAAARLTRAQEAKIQALLQRQPAPSLAKQKAEADEWKRIMGATELDTEALAAFLEARDAEAATQRTQALAVFRELRGLLSAGQRTAVGRGIRQAIAQAKRRPPAGGQGQGAGPQGGAGQAQPPDLGLTAEQAALFQAATPATAPGDHEAAAAALATFFERGDQPSLAKAFPAIALRIDALVEAYEGLTPAQRRKLLVEPEGEPSGGARGG